MKLNFLKVLNTNKSSTDEIAAEIAALEQKLKECGQEYALITDQAKSLRSKKLCGEAVSEADIRDADRKVESSRLDSEAISETIAKLKEKLRNAFQAIKDNNVAESQRRWDYNTPWNLSQRIR